MNDMQRGLNLVCRALVKAKEGKPLTDEEKELVNLCPVAFTTMKKDFMGRWYI